MTKTNKCLFLCPQCRQPLPLRPPCSCGFVLHDSDGIINLLSREEAAAMQPFLDAYEQVRTAEEWGGDDLDLPFCAKRHHHIWEIRQRTFRSFEAIVSRIQRGPALDIGAGNCWMTRYLDRWGFDATAIDVNVSKLDGLGAGQKYIDEGAVFLRVRAGMERLPFASGQIALLAANGSFHYASDFSATLSEFERVLAPGGIIAIIDTPFYENASDGEHMMAERVTEFRQKYRIGEILARRSRYLTFDILGELASVLDLKYEVYRVWPGWRRRVEEIRGKIAGRGIARFPLVLLDKR